MRFSTDLLYCIEATCLFVVMSSPLTYRVTDAMFGRGLRTTVADRPTVFGLVCHALIYAGVAYVLLKMASPVNYPQHTEASATCPSTA